MAKRQSVRLIQIAAAYVACAAALSAAPSPGGDGAIAPAFALVELFTSEGCSSCPPADALLGELASRGRTKGLSIYCLAFHVDYWNQLGWTDPFSAAEYSTRQKTYARVMRSPQIYTPQMIVNGTEEFVGSDRLRAEHVIDAALSRSASVKLNLQAARERGDSQEPSPTATVATTRVTYAVTGGPKNAVLHVAAVESGLASSVSRGENAGHVLRHENVVRAFSTVPLEKGMAGTVTLTVPQGTVAGHTSIIGYVQDGSTMAILGAAAIPYQ